MITTPERLEAERENFEKHAFAQRFISSVQRVGTGCMTFQSVACPTKDEFTKRDEDGDYEDMTLNAMWWAWEKRAKEGDPT